MIIDPTEIWQTAVRNALIADSDLLELVDPANIQTGSSKPDRFPCIRLSDPQTINRGTAAGGYFVTTVYLDLHIWTAPEQIMQGASMVAVRNAATAQTIAAQVAKVLWYCPPSPGHILHDYERPSFRFSRDPDPDNAHQHGVGTVKIDLYWKA